MNLSAHRRRGLRDTVRVVLCVSLLFAQSFALSEEPHPQPAPIAAKITITGFINQCYSPNKWLVFITSFPRGRFESPTQVLRADGRFRFVLDPAKLTPGPYFLEFGKTRKGTGMMKFAVTQDTTTIDFGEVGECDV